MPFMMNYQIKLVKHTIIDISLAKTIEDGVIATDKEQRALASEPIYEVQVALMCCEHEKCCSE
jgi:hypothetical protein